MIQVQFVTVAIIFTTADQVGGNKGQKTEAATWTFRRRGMRERHTAAPGGLRSAEPTNQPQHTSSGAAGQTSDWKLGRRSSVTAFPESTPFKLTIWNILGELQGEGGGAGAGGGGRKAAFLDLLFYSLLEKKKISVSLPKKQTGGKIFC